MKNIICILFFIASFSVYAANEKTLTETLSQGVRYSMDEEGNRFVKIGLGVQTWARYMEFNPGTVDFEGNSISDDIDFTLRRTLTSFSGSFDRFTFFSLLAMDSQTPSVHISPYGDNKPQFFFYDTWLSYDIIENYLGIGFGLNMFNGTSRYASASSSRTLGVDPTSIGVPNLITTEQFARQMGFFLSGQYNIINFRLSLSKPFIADTRYFADIYDFLPETFEIPNNNLSVKSYITLQMLEKESYKMPFKTATYLGTKKVFNIGFGFDYHPQSTITYDADKTYKNDKIHFGIDLFYDTPLKNNDALTLYLGAFYFDYGPNYLLSYGVMNPFDGALNQFQNGTGTAMHLEAGYVLPLRVNKEHKIQPFIQCTFRNFDAMPEYNIHYNAGINYYFADHFIKTTFQWEGRPVWNSDNSIYNYFNCFIFKTQLFF